MNVGELLTNTARSYPERVAFYWDGQQRTYGECNQRADALARALADLGVGRGDRVALSMANRPELMEAMFAAWKLGAAVVPLNARFTADEIEYHVDDPRARAMIVGPENAETVLGMRDRLPTVEHVIEVGAKALGGLALDDLLDGFAGPSFPAVDVEADELAWLAYTSGTTGRPKGAMLTHGVLVFESLAALADSMRLEVEDVGMHAAPLTHGSGHNALVFTMKGCSQVLHQPSGFDVELFLEQVPKFGVNALFMVPTMIKMVVDHPAAAEADLSSLRSVIYGGAPMYVEDLRKALALFGNVFVQLFGQTESPMTGTILRAQEHVLDGPLSRRLGSCGRARSGVQIRILDEEDRPCATGEAGEICIRGGSVMKGYWERPEETAETLRGGWLHTGDIGKMDEDGYVYILDRTKDMVISGGLNIYPREIEEVLLTHPFVSEACVFGVPDDKWGEALRAHVVATEGTVLSEDEIIAYVGERLAGYKKPKAVEFVDSLPKTVYGKLDKRAVRAPYWAGQERMVR
jgi:acyl-CoA synthetase (AMP-forming)/AMP-acid ligase II